MVLLLSSIFGYLFFRMDSVDLQPWKTILRDAQI